MIRALAIVGLGLLLAGHAAAAPQPSWRTLADCAGAYEANARVADPDRPVAMVGQMRDVAEDYARAARAAFQQRGGAGAAAARRAVKAQADATAARLAKAPRDAAEKLIDACPQVGG